MYFRWEESYKDHPDFVIVTFMNFSSCPQVPVDPTLIGYVALGLLGSTQCIGSCGSYILSLAPVGGSKRAKAIRLLEFGMGRMLAYLALGAVAGAVGHSASIGGYLPAFRLTFEILAAAALLIVGLSTFGIGKRYPIVAQIPGYQWLKQSLVATAQSTCPTAWGAIQLGFISGLVPSPLVCIAAMYAFLGGTPVNGMFIMLLFGIGTGPAMLWVGVSGYFIGPMQRVRVLTLTGVLLMLLSIISLSICIPRSQLAYQAACGTSEETIDFQETSPAETPSESQITAINSF